jgi:2-polyprenyl-6-methoxyphenol hydroxylase-like FAD-dependent oxidoreductase
MALGICDAFRDAALLSAAIHEGLSGGRPMEQALGAYERARNSAAMDDHRQNIALARFSPMPPEFMRLRQALRGNPVDTTRFIMAREGMIPAQEFFNPENMERVISNAAG